jgi:PRC-barrel domain
VTAASRRRCRTWLLLAGALLPTARPDLCLAAPPSRTAPAVTLAQDKAAAPAGGANPQAAAEPAPGPAPTSSPAPPKNLEALPPGKYIGVLGKDVAGPDGKDLGPIVDVIVNVDGTPRAAVIDFGGFLGVGSRKIAVDWRLLNFAPDRTDGQIWLSLDRAEIAAAPEYRSGSPSDEMVGPPWVAPPAPGAGK